MQNALYVLPCSAVAKQPYLTKTLRVMKLVIFLTVAACLQVSANGYSQTITLSLKNVPLEKVFSEIQKQSSYSFIYTKEQLENAPPVTIVVKDASLDLVLETCFKDQPVTYVLSEKYIIVKRKEPVKPNSPAVPLPIEIKGKVTNEKGEPIAGVTVQVKGTNISTTTDNNGEFSLKVENDKAVVIFSGAETMTQEIKVNDQKYLTITLKVKLNELDQVVIMAYGETTKRLNTGNISKVTAEEIQKQPVSNPLAALQGRVPGLIITQGNGLPGSGFQVQIRGQNSLFQGSDPFFVIDGVPFAPGNTPVNLLSNATSSQGLSPFNLINLDDIESIEVLKDADATAIYGSRGANGVILITTKKGKNGKTNISANVYTSWSKVTRTMDMLNTQQYVEMRKEAFANDGLTPTLTNAPDLLAWDTTRYTDLKKLLIGGTGRQSNIHLSVSGGNAGTNFSISGSYHDETSVFPSTLGDKRASAHFNLNHASENKHFKIEMNTSYSTDKNELSISDATAYIRYPPHIRLYDSTGKLNWIENGVPFSNLFIINPLSIFNTRYTGRYRNLISNIGLNYTFYNGFSLKANLGYNQFNGDEVSTSPSTSINPYSSTLPSAKFANSIQTSWIIEPQAEYIKMIKKGVLTLLLGGTWQENQYNSLSVAGENYSSDLLLNSIAGAGSISSATSSRKYRYQAGFARINYNWLDKYIINLSGRHDGSSRFGPGRQFANFSAIGLAWILTKESLIKRALPILSFGKLRGSYGTTGNDQIGDYKYLDSWTASSNTYQGISVLNPSSLFNPDYSWEVNRKKEIAIDLGFLKDRILFSTSFYINESHNQLVNYTLPVQTGFTSVNKNLNAIIRNKGLEFQLTGNNIVSKNFSWITILNLSINKNKLIDFPNLALSSYSTSYFIGEPVSSRKRYHFTGVDAATGIYRFDDINRDGIITEADKTKMVNTLPEYYGGLDNRIVYKQFQLDFLLEFKKQKGINYLGSFIVPGYRYNNQPVIVLERWQKPGDITDIQKFTASVSPALISFNSILTGSDGIISDASYIRFKNIALSYSFSSDLLKKIAVKNARIYMNAQNLFTITRYVGADPENQDMFVLPPLRTISAGIMLNL